MNIKTTAYQINECTCQNYYGNKITIPAGIWHVTEDDVCYTLTHGTDMTQISKAEFNRLLEEGFVSKK